ncbi:cryptochrome [Xylona heveae TC161]|uniref:Cryptochrome DASH n=1 Tax=Xylona heveae (strain CBS 132557 / TC161) TaxID=1328760 RepID=A0A165FER1_XYLHT|nr:cryptochrome [Xylona heveae TC161]KZF20892.1 cryptochrome [Xylona heveae TC161]
MTSSRILIYVLRRDLRLADNPILHEVSRVLRSSQNASFTHLLPLYVFPAQQVEVSGFLSPGTTDSPYAEARSKVGGFWRTGHHRVKFLAESVWDTKSSLEKVGSGLEIRVGVTSEVIKDMLEAYKTLDGEVSAVWMTEEEGWEEKQDEENVRTVVEAEGKEFQLWKDEKYFIDDIDLGPSRDIPFQDPKELPDVFTSYRKMVEPLREAPRKSVPPPSQLLPLPDSIPPQSSPFVQPSSLENLIAALEKPLHNDDELEHPPKWPNGANSAFPFSGGEKAGHERIKHLVTSGSMSAYKDTRNGLLGEDFSTKLAAWLALGCITARQVHEYLLEFEDGSSALGSDAIGYGNGENKGTAAVRFELLWRDYMRLCTRKFGARLFHIDGFRHGKSVPWKYVDGAERKNKRRHSNSAVDAAEALQRFLEGRSGTGLIDASMRELYLTGYTSNRARQNVASFLAKHLRIDWRLGAEWYETQLVDYDVSSNWGNWQYNAGVGNDPRGEGRVFNPIKQAFDYDPQGEYVKTWVPELRDVEDPLAVFQAWRLPVDQRKALGLEGVEWVENPLKRIDFYVSKPSKGSGTFASGNRNRQQEGQGRNDLNDEANAAEEAQGTSRGSSNHRRGRGWGRARGRGRGRSRGRGGGRGGSKGHTTDETPRRKQNMGRMDNAATLEEAIA